jgi:hypothetical protein
MRSSPSPGNSIFDLARKQNESIQAANLDQPSINNPGLITRHSKESIGSLAARNINLQSLIDREIILDTLIQNFSQGESVV